MVHAQTRRNFFATLAKAAAGFTILPAATTYSRVWRAQRVVEPVACAVYVNLNDFAGVWVWNAKMRDWMPPGLHGAKFLEANFPPICLEDKPVCCADWRRV